MAAGILDVSVTNHKIKLRGKTMQAQLNKILEEAKEQLQQAASVWRMTDEIQSKAAG